MSNDPNIKLVYIPAQYRVRAEISKWDVMHSPVPPPDIIRRAKTKLQAEVDAGRLAYYLFFESRLAEFWRRMQRADVSEDTALAVTLATGAPPMTGLQVDVVDRGPVVAKVTVAAEPEEVQRWRFPLFKLTIGRELRRAGSTAIADPAHLQSLYLQAVNGGRVILRPVMALDKTPPPEGDWFRVVHHVDRREVAIVVYDVTAFADEAGITSWKDQLAAKIDLLGAETGCRYKFLEADLVRSARSFYRGVERLGMDLPVTLLAAYRPIGGRRAQARPVSIETPPDQFRGRCRVEVSDEGMVATLHCREGNRLRGLGREEWSGYLVSQGIVHGIDDIQLSAVIQAIDAGHDEVTAVVAHGTLPVEAGEPVLARRRTPADDIRDAQQTKLVRAGDVVAEVEFRVPAQPGQNVYGDQISPPPPEIPEVTVSDGIASEDGMEFYATVDGELALDEFRVSLKAALSLKGDVNLATGNVFFDGSGVIEGNIEEGSTVHVTGDLHVKGAILSANVRVGGRLQVDGGIIGNGGQRLRVGDDLQCKFVENADIEVQGLVLVERAIIASRVYAGVGLTMLDSDAKIFGGQIEAWEFVETPSLGKSGGQLTKVYVGGRERQVRRLNRLLHREQKLERRMTEEKMSLKFLEEKRMPAPRDAREVKAARLMHMARTLEVIRSHIEIVRGGIEQNLKARITVPGILYRNVEIQICGRPVKVKDNLESVEVRPTRHRGSHIWPLDEAELNRAG